MSGDDSIGPILPPGFGGHSASHADLEEDEIGPALPPTHTVRPSDSEIIPKCINNESSDDEDFGPQLPPGLDPKGRNESKPLKIVGPTMPPQFIGSSLEIQDIKESDTYDSDSDNEEMIGPHLPISDKCTSLTAAQEFDERSKKMKKKLLGLDEDDAARPAGREEWMMELPPEMTKNFGLGPRKFRQKATEIGDRSGWTETPQDRANKSKGNTETDVPITKRPHDEMMDRMMHDRDLAINKEVSQYNETKRAESLLDMHTKKKKVPTATLR